MNVRRVQTKIFTIVYKLKLQGRHIITLQPTSIIKYIFSNIEIFTLRAVK